MVNARIRKAYVQKKTPIFSIGNPGDLTYDYTILGNKSDYIKKILELEEYRLNKKALMRLINIKLYKQIL